MVNSLTSEQNATHLLEPFENDWILILVEFAQFVTRSICWQCNKYMIYIIARHRIGSQLLLHEVMMIKFCHSMHMRLLGRNDSSQVTHQSRIQGGSYITGDHFKRVLKEEHFLLNVNRSVNTTETSLDYCLMLNRWKSIVKTIEDVLIYLTMVRAAYDVAWFRLYRSE